MDGSTVIYTAILTLLIILYDWPNLKKKGSRADKVTFISLLAIAVVVSFFDLASMPGPVTLLGKIFKPFKDFMG